MAVHIRMRYKYRSVSFLIFLSPLSALYNSYTRIPPDFHESQAYFDTESLSQDQLSLSTHHCYLFLAAFSRRLSAPIDFEHKGN
ncbi:uncharacterized protein LY89DRAFT_50241 [Mollisia scopiformis]|uniref:Uncharacterized protein n=1 Tax=Mollisia scopiformis TaxID=149040 RepID=A0A194XAX4_MOLSC|nr:uncharacterized protein LY89DRAFT_50241 [Mollisia scopiformis]KUJ17294.1 hypothetical protein LY89DRAFT_50241 [Mollisia scopiformis]